MSLDVTRVTLTSTGCFNCQRPFLLHVSATVVSMSLKKASTDVCASLSSCPSCPPSYVCTRPQCPGYVPRWALTNLFCFPKISLPKGVLGLKTCKTMHGRQEGGQRRGFRCWSPRAPDVTRTLRHPSVSPPEEQEVLMKLPTSPACCLSAARTHITANAHRSTHATPMQGVALGPRASAKGALQVTSATSTSRPIDLPTAILRSLEHV